MPNTSSIATFFQILKSSVSKFLEDDLMTDAAALAYYTIFSLPPMLLVILMTATQFYNEQAVKSAIFGEIESLIGQQSASQLAGTLDRLGVFDTVSWTTAISAGTLLFTATTVFVTIQNALNKTFKVKARPKGLGILKFLRDRLLSFSFLIGIGFVLLASLVINALISSFIAYLDSQIGHVSAMLTLLTSALVPLMILTVFFAMIFKFLPDAKLQWKDTWRGAIFTAICFSIGKELIGIYIGNSQTANLYEAAGSVMVIMVWVFFTSTIFLFGAVFTCEQAKLNTGKIQPADYAVKVVHQDIEITPEEDNDYRKIE